jgi:hypothetical protein
MDRMFTYIVYSLTVQMLWLFSFSFSYFLAVIHDEILITKQDATDPNTQPQWHSSVPLTNACMFINPSASDRFLKRPFSNRELTCTGSRGLLLQTAMLCPCAAAQFAHCFSMQDAELTHCIRDDNSDVRLFSSMQSTSASIRERTTSPVEWNNWWTQGRTCYCWGKPIQKHGPWLQLLVRTIKWNLKANNARDNVKSNACLEL